MAVPGFELNPLERVLFRVALFLAGVLIVVRVGAVIVLTFLHHHR